MAAGWARLAALGVANWLIPRARWLASQLQFTARMTRYDRWEPFVVLVAAAIVWIGTMC